MRPIGWVGSAYAGWVGLHFAPLGILLCRKPPPRFRPSTFVVGPRPDLRTPSSVVVVVVCRCRRGRRRRRRRGVVHVAVDWRGGSSRARPIGPDWVWIWVQCPVSSSRPMTTLCLGFFSFLGLLCLLTNAEMPAG